MALMQKKEFIRGGEGAIASYSYSDIQEGTGITIFYPFGRKDSVGTSYSLSTQTFYGNPKQIQNNGAGSTSFDFDLTAFNLPKTVKGTFYVDGSMMVHSNAGSPTAQTLKVTFTLKKYSGGTATDMGSVITETISCPDSSQTTLNSFIVAGSLTQTSFKKGDVLRLTITLDGAGTTGGGVQAVAIDPLNRDNASYYFTAANNQTRLRLFVPFRLDT